MLKITSQFKCKIRDNWLWGIQYVIAFYIYDNRFVGKHLTGQVVRHLGNTYLHD